MQNQHFFYRSEGKLRQINLEDIVILQAAGNYTKFVTTEGKEILVRATLEDCLALLPKNTFLRTHRGFAVAGQYIGSIERDNVRLPVIKTDVSVSKQYYPSLMKQIVILHTGTSKTRKKS